MPATAPMATAPCDVSAAASSPRRAWLRGSSRPVVVADVRGTEVLIASVDRAVIVTRWVPLSELGRAVRVETPVSHTPGGPPDPALFALPGFPVESTTAPWAQIFSVSPLKFSGYVPYSATGTIFDAAPERTEGTIAMSFTVHTGASDDAPVLGVITSGARVRVTAHLQPPWLEVTAWGPFGRIAGFVKQPPPRPAREVSGTDFSEIEIDGTAPEWLPVGACLRDRPNGKIVGAIVGTLWTKPKALPGGGAAVSVDTPWGDATYYVRESITEPPAVPDEEHFVWPYRGEDWGGGN